MPTHIVPQILLPRDSARLGRFVTSIKNPQRNHHDPGIRPTEHTLSHEAYTGEQHSARGSSFHSRLFSLVSSRCFNQHRERLSISAGQVNRYILDNADSWFREVISSDETQRWIERSIHRGRSDIYVMVGFSTITNANINQVSFAGSGAGGNMELPASQALAATGLVVPPGAAINPEVAAQSDSMLQTQLQFGIVNEEVCAIEYCKLRHTWFQGRNLDRSRLSERMYYWPSKLTLRSEQEDEEFLQVEWAGVERIDGQWDEAGANGERFLIRSVAPGENS